MKINNKNDYNKYMDNLCNQYHGLPGIGIKGLQGEKGEKGNSMYIGYINNFFDGVFVNTDNAVKIAQRLINDDLSTFIHDTEFKNINKYIKKLTSKDNFYDASFIDNEINTRYYTGMISIPKDTSNCFDICDNYLVAANTIADNSIDSIFIEKINSEDDTDLEFIKIIKGNTKHTNIIDVCTYNKDNSSTYYDLYNFIGNEVKTLTTYIQLPFNNISAKLLMTYEDNDAAKLLGKGAEYYKAYKDGKGITDSDLVTTLDKNGKPITIPGLYDTFLRESFVSNNDPVYAQGADHNYAKLDSDYISSIEYYDISRYLDILNLDEGAKNYYIKNSFKINYDDISDGSKAKDFYNNNLFLDSNNYAYYCVDSSIMYNNDGTLRSESNIADDVSNWYQFKKEYYSQYYQNTRKLLNIDIDNVYIDNHKVVFASADDTSIFIPTTLRSTYTVGDTIYFYTTDPKKVQDFKKIDFYMVVLTQELLQCSPETLIENAQYANPFQIQTLQIQYLNNFDKSRIANFNMLGVTFKNDYINNDVTNNYFNNSISSILNNTNDPAINIICTSTCKTNKFITFQPIYNDIDTSNLNTKLSVSSSKTQLGYSTNFKSNNLKFENLLVPKTYKETNIETYIGLYDENIILYDDFLKPITTLNQYINDNNITLLGTELFAKDYFYDTNDTDYMYGYELYLHNQLIQSDCTNSEKLQCIISFDTLERQLIEEPLKSFIVYDKIFLENTSNIILSWDDIIYKYANIAIKDNIIYAIYVPEDCFEQNNINIKKAKNVPKLFVSLNNKHIYTYAKQDIDTGIFIYNEELALYYDNNFNLITFGSIKKHLISLDKCYQYNIKTNVADIQYENVYIGEYYISSWAGKNGLKKYSTFSKINILVDKNLVLKNYNIEIIGDTTKLIEEKGNNFEFKINNTTVDECKSTIQIIPNSEDISINAIYINNSLLDISKGASKKITKWATIKKEDITNYSIDLSSNLPTTEIYKDNDEYKYKNVYFSNLTNYLEKYRDDNQTTNECLLFQILKDGIKLPSTTNRSLTFTIEYIKQSSTSSIKYYENYNFIQPGFEDTRNVPNIDLKLYTSFDDLQNINTSINGVLCNQFVTYLDVNINDFNNWTKYLNNDLDVSIDIHINNIASDIEYQKKYIIKNNIVNRSTIKPIHCYADISTCENYIGLNTRYIREDNDVYGIDSSINEYINYQFENNGYYAGNIEINDSINIVNDNKINYSLEKSDYFEDGEYGEKNKCGGKKYIYTNILHDKNKYYSKYEGIERGINYTINIDLKGLTIVDIEKNKLRFKIEYEMGNPLISNIYLRFVVSSITIHFGNITYTTKIPQVSPGTADVTSLYSITKELDQTYRIISNKLDVITNPLSYILCDTNNESDIANIQGTSKKYGSTNQIQENILFYNKDLYTNEQYIKTENSDKFSNQNIRLNYYYAWNSAILKTKYFQDNIENIDVQMLNINEMINKINNHRMREMKTNEAITKLLSSNNKENISNTSAIAVYNSNIFTNIEQNGIKKFMYNDKYLISSRYNQITPKKPIFLTLQNSLSIRSKQLIDSMDIWNDEYLYADKLSTDQTFTGYLSMYGNGYLYLDEKYDNGQYKRAIIDEYTPNIPLIRSNIEKINNEKINCFTLQETKDYNNFEIFNYENCKNIDYRMASSQKINKTTYSNKVVGKYAYANAYSKSPIGSFISDENPYKPYSNELYRSLLYDMKLEYQYINKNNAIPYRILSDYDYMLCRIYDSNTNQINNNMKNRLEALQLIYDVQIPTNKARYNDNEVGIRSIPYSLLYSIYPRVAYNNEYDTVNILMLRKPVFEKDNDISFNNNTISKSGYNLNKHYFKLKDGQSIKDIEYPYNI